MSVPKIDLATRRDIVAQLSEKKRIKAMEQKEAAGVQRLEHEREQNSRWRPLVISSASDSPYLCHCRDVKRGFANVCPAHMLTFRFGQSVH